MCRVVTTDVLKCALMDHLELIGSGRIYGNMINLINAVATAQKVTCQTCPMGVGIPDKGIVYCEQSGGHMEYDGFCSHHPQLAPLDRKVERTATPITISLEELQEAWAQAKVGANDGMDVTGAFEAWMLAKLPHKQTITYRIEED